MTPSQQDENIYSVPLIQYGSESASGSGSQLAGTSLTSNGIFIGFPIESMTCSPSEYPNYSWTTSGSGTFEATSAACQPQCKSEGEDYLQRPTHLMGLQFTDDCTTLPDDVQAYSSPPDLFAQRATHLPRTIADGCSSSGANGPLPPSSSMIAPGSPHANGNHSWMPDTWNTFDSKPSGPIYQRTIDPRCTLAAPFTNVPTSTLPGHPSSKPLEDTLHQVARLQTAHDPLFSVSGGQSLVQTQIYASEQEELDAIRALIRRADFMTSNPQCIEPNVASLEDHYTGGRGIMGKSIFTAFIRTLSNGEYQCIQCKATYKKLERAIGDQARHFGFKPYICEEKHDGKTVCGKAFGMKDYRKTHQERENKPSVQCNDCGAAIKHERNLRRHMHQVHGQVASPTSLSKRPTKRRAVGKVVLYRTMWK